MKRIIENLSMKNIIYFVLPSIFAMVIASVYTMVDGLFVARFVGTDALAAINIVFPYFNLIYAIALVLGTGGNAIIGHALGQGNTVFASRMLTLFYVIGTVLGILGMIFSLCFSDSIVRFLGASDILFPYATDYLKIIGLFSVGFIIQVFAQLFLVCTGKPSLGMWIIIIGGLLNILFDYIFIVPMKMGVIGAAIATGLSALISGLIGMICFMKLNSNQSLYFMTPVWNTKILLQAIYNGSSEGITNIASGIITYMLNITIFSFLQEQGVAAITAILYIQFFMSAIFIGFGMGIAPLFSYTYGSNEYSKTQQIYHFSIAFITIVSIIAFVLFFFFAEAFMGLFFPKDNPVFSIATHGLYIFIFSVLASGINIFGSALFTAFSNGKISALISFCRSFGFIIICLLILPKYLGINGVWLAVPIAEILSLFLTIYLLIKYRNIYRY